MPTKESIRTAERDKRITRRFGLKLNINTDADIIAALEAQPSMQGFVKNAIRAYIAAQKEEEK